MKECRHLSPNRLIAPPPPPKRLRFTLEKALVELFWESTGPKPATGSKRRKKCKGCGAERAFNTSKIIAHISKCKKIPQEEVDRIKNDPNYLRDNLKSIQVDADLILAKLVAQENLAFSIINSKNFKNYTAILCRTYSPPSATTLVRKIDGYSPREGWLQSIRESAKRSICVSYDTWTDAKGRSILAFHTKTLGIRLVKYLD